MKEMFEIFEILQLESNLKPDSFTFANIIHNYNRSNNIQREYAEKMEEIVDLLLTHYDIYLNKYICSCLFQYYAKQDNIPAIDKLLQTIKTKKIEIDDTSLGTLILVFGKMGEFVRMERIYEEFYGTPMQDPSIVPNSENAWACRVPNVVILSNLLSGYSHANSATGIYNTLDIMEKFEVKVNEYVISLVFIWATKNKNITAIFGFFDRFEDSMGDLNLKNLRIRMADAYLMMVSSKRADLAVQFFRRLVNIHFPFTQDMFVDLLCELGKHNAMNEVLLLFPEFVKCGIYFDDSLIFLIFHSFCNNPARHSVNFKPLADLIQLTAFHLPNLFSFNPTFLDYLYSLSIDSPESWPIFNYIISAIINYLHLPLPNSDAHSASFNPPENMLPSFKDFTYLKNIFTCLLQSYKADLVTCKWMVDYFAELPILSKKGSVDHTLIPLIKLFHVRPDEELLSKFFELFNREPTRKGMAVLYRLIAKHFAEGAIPSEKFKSSVLEPMVKYYESVSLQERVQTLRSFIDPRQ